MNDNDIDLMLREYAPRWRTAQPPPPTVDSALRATRSPSRARPRRWVPVLAAAAAVLVVAAVVGLARRNLSAPEPGLTPTPTGDPGVVAWQPLAPTHPELPTTVVPSSPDPADAAGLPACRPADLRVSTSLDGAGGTRYVVVEFRSRGRCRLGGFPSVTPLDGDGRPVAVPVERELNGYGRPVAVGGDAVATLMIGWPSGWCADEVNVARLRLTLAGGAPLTVPGFGRSACNGEPGSGTTMPITVRDIRPQQYVEERTVTPFDGVAVRVVLPTSAPGGATLRFTVVLTAPAGGNVPLRPCPDYRVSLGGSEAVYALHCAAVPFRDASGQPYLPAGVPVTFDMRLAVPRAPGSDQKFIWQLENTAAAAGGLVEVT